MAIVAGTSLIFTPTGTASLWPALSPDGTCKSFDASANGYARGEAINAILVKPLADAVQAGDAIRAIIRGTAVNFDGKTPSLTVPSSLTHEKLMRKAYMEAALDPKDTPFVEVCSLVTFTFVHICDQVKGTFSSQISTFSQSRVPPMASFHGSPYHL